MTTFMMENLSNTNLPNLILSIAIAAGTVAFGFLVLRIIWNTFKLLANKVKIKQSGPKQP